MTTAAEVHSHGAYASGIEHLDTFSPKDTDGYDTWASLTNPDGNPLFVGYVITPNGSLQKYEPHADEDKKITIISCDMPYDPKHPKPLKPTKPE